MSGGNFAMLVIETAGPYGAEVIGRRVLGPTPPPSTPVWLVRRYEEALRARIVDSEDLPDSRVRLVLDGWGNELISAGHGVATDPALFEPWPPPPPELRVDRYFDYSGVPLAYTWGDWGAG